MDGTQISAGTSRRGLLAGAGLVAGSMLLAACTTKTVTPTSNGGLSGTSGAVAAGGSDYDAAVRKLVGGRTIQIGYTVPVLSEYFNEIQSAAWQKMAEYEQRFGVKWKWELAAPSASYKSVEQHVSIVQTWVTRKFDAVFICTSANFATMQNVYEEAAAAGTAIYEYNMPVELHPEDQLRTVSTVGYNNDTQSGYVAGKYIADALGGTGNVLALFGPSGSEYSKMRGDGLRRAFSEYPGMKIVGEADGGYVRDKGFTAAQDLLTAHKDVSAIYGENEDMALGASQAIDQAGLKHWDGKDGIITVGADGLVSGMEAIKAGNLTATVDVGPVDTGLRLVETMFANKVLGYAVAPKVYVPTKVVDKSNVDIPLAYLNWAVNAPKSYGK
jgi:ABC-type sugar transport system substrate-binding protein